MTDRGKFDGAFPVQGSFGRSLIHPEREDDPATLADIVPGGSLTEEQAVGVYRGGYYARLTEQLGETFEAVWAVLGDESFFRVCTEFAGDHPSRSYNLSDYGREFPEWLAKVPEVRNLPFLCELGEFEWKFKELFHCAEHDPVAPEALAGITDLETTRVRIGDACFLFSASYAVYDIWKRRGENNGEGSEETDWTRAQRGLAYKRDGEIFVRVLGPGPYHMLEALRAGSPFGEAVTQGAGAQPDLSAQEVSALFQTLAHSGIVTDIEPLLT